MDTSRIVLVLLCLFFCYVASEDQSTDVDECDIPGSCSQICHNENGTVRCDCVDGYQIDSVDNRRCKATVGNASLILTNGDDIITISLENHNRTVLVNEAKSSFGLDFHYHNGTIFWSNPILNNIYKREIKEGSNRIDVISIRKTRSGSLAVDWIYNNIYWTVDEEKNPGIEMSNMDGTMRKSIISDRSGAPHTIVVNPLEGWLFWTDIGPPGKIERAGMDGTRREVIVSTNIGWPYALTLDWVQRRIYWGDAQLDAIFSCHYDGSGRKQILHDKKDLKFPFSISVFEDNMYFTDSVKGKIFKANKFNGSDFTTLDLLIDVVELKIYHPYTQPDGVNHCGPDNGNCSHLCLPAPQVHQHSPKTTCACPDEMILMPGGYKCIEPPLYAYNLTFVVVSPDGVQNGLLGEIMKKFESRSSRLVAMKMAWLTEDWVHRFHPELPSKPFFLGLVEKNLSRPFLTMVWEVNRSRSTQRNSEFQDCAPDTTREATQTGRDIVYCSDSVAIVLKEIGFWFKENEIPSWTPALKNYI